MTLNWKTGLLVVAIISVAFATSVLASTLDPWGPQWYTPYTGNAEANKEYVAVTSLHWTQDSINEYDFKDAWEWEFRPNNSVSTWDIWGEKQNFLTNLPNGYYEHTSNDHDDVAIGAHSLQNASTSTSYYGYLAMEPLYPASYPTFQLESEYCYDGGYLTYPVGDAIPIRYELFPTNAQINTDYYW